MIKLKEVQKEIHDIIHYDFRGMSVSEIEKEKKKHRTRMKFLKTISLYLEKDPTEEFIKKELQRISDRVNIVVNSFSYELIGISHSDTKAIKEAKKEYYKEYSVDKMYSQIRALRYLLK